jgi:hypothetical protein
MKVHDMTIAWCLRPFVRWPLGTPVLIETEREVDPGTGIAAPKGEVVGGTVKVNGNGSDEGEIGTDAIQQDATMKAYLSPPLPPGNNRPWEMLSVSILGHNIPARGFTPQ